ncbi:MAG TPA: flagellar biosynthetic protein FliR [Steroidobacteraceae bacterium]|jgi:flagellar biosynthetic protein FliR|nr:flagellar biosynthetic protein FliR [Steroidobacteraceae bacterium]
MITLTTGQLETWLGQLLWPFIRVGSCLMVAPVFSSQAVPGRIRIVLAGAIAIILAPMISIPPQLQPFSIEGLVVTAQQVVIGIALGFCLQLVFDAITLGGQLIANSMGLSYALSVDPIRGTGTTALGDMYTIFVTLVFLALDGHLRLIEVLADGFRTLPVGGSGFGTTNLWQIVSWGGTLFSGALSIALPGITALLIVNMAFGMVSRTAPTLNLMAVGFPVMLIFGLLVLVVSVPQLLSGFERLLEQTFMVLQSLSGARI